jgi:hypothetical protein
MAGAGTASADRSPWPPGNGNVEVSKNLTARNYYVVLDGSGSMGERACRGAGNKIEQARSALDAFARAVPKNANLGLLVFQGRVGERVPLDVGNRDHFVREVLATSPSGGTPLSTAIALARSKLEEQARRQLGYGEYHLVVVTDGEASPGYDPRSVVYEMLAGTPIVLHTIGFCISTRHSLNQPGRTIYRAANDVQELKRGLEEVLAEAPSFTEQRFNPNR